MGFAVWETDFGSAVFHFSRTESDIRNTLNGLMLSLKR